MEWSSGGRVHTHIAFWIVGAPRIGKVVVPTATKSDSVEIDVTPEDAVVLPQEDVANLLATFLDRVISDFNVAKHVESLIETVEGDAVDQLRAT
jgi:hypothetical protein